jgi:hypothetical protein
MAARLEVSTREEQRAVIRFLGSEGEKPADIHRRIKRQYGDACVSLQQVYQWHRKFKSGVLTFWKYKVLYRPNPGILHAQATNYQQRIILCSASEPLETCNHFKTSLFFQFWCVVIA